MLRRLLATTLILLPTAAFADTFSIFQVQGVFLYGAPLSGTFTLDTTTGVVTGSSLVVQYASSRDVFNYAPINQGPDGNGDGRYLLEFESFDGFHMPPSTFSILYLELPTFPAAGQTVQICTISTPCVAPFYPTDFESYDQSVSGGFGQYRSNLGLSSGQVGPLTAATVTPEPSSLVLLGTGLMAVGCGFRRRRLG